MSAIAPSRHGHWLDDEPRPVFPDPPVMPPIYEAAIALAEAEAEQLKWRLLDRTGARYTRSLDRLAHYHGLIAWCYRRLHAHRCATLQHCRPPDTGADLGQDLDSIPF